MTSVPLPFDDDACIKAYASLAKARLTALGKLRSTEGRAYSDAVLTYIHETMDLSLPSTMLTAGWRPRKIVAEPTPILTWIQSRRGILSNTFDALWRAHAEGDGLDTSTIPADIGLAMRLEREFRFWEGALTPIARHIRLEPVPLSQPIVRHINKFKIRAKEMRSLVSILLDDPYLERSLSEQDTLWLSHLPGALDAMYETFSALKVRALYPTQNDDDTARERALVNETAEAFIRSFGVCDPDAIEQVGRIPELDFDGWDWTFDLKWASERVRETRKKVSQSYKLRTYIDIRLPPEGDDGVRFSTGNSPWLALGR